MAIPFSLASRPLASTAKPYAPDWNAAEVYFASSLELSEARMPGPGFIMVSDAVAPIVWPIELEGFRCEVAGMECFHYR
ncbi:hypothetical protein B0T16DRAFT_406214 [Cercophora newfieldiana]|uniref:Uncharacterized protein n=1 Tax=Cercophora newfieldiana TaxID=92897 RepID=A0AA39YH05_9PEZI|nr:hypothetical protein B0T16DRAFT_406214 [Cercophora newfieldiana]